MMIIEKIQALIDKELNLKHDLTNVFGVDLKKALIKPVKQKYKDAFDPLKSANFWTVLEETADGNGYKIFYDEHKKEFGLGIITNDRELINIGYHGTFLASLESI